MPVGTVIWYVASTPPQGFLVCNGQSTAGYPALSAVVGANVPDLRGEFVRGLDLERGIDSGRTLRSSQLSQSGDHYHGTGQTRGISGDRADDWISINRTWNDGNIYQGQIVKGDGNAYSFFTADGTYAGATGTTNQINITGGDEIRPRNIALLPCIKY